MGPGLLESAYSQCLARELDLREIAFILEKPIPVEYKGTKLDCGYRIDLLVEERVLIELKSVEMIADIHIAQLLTYMKIAKIRIGLIINFNVKLLKDGIRRFVL